MMNLINKNIRLGVITILYFTLPSNIVFAEAQVIVDVYGQHNGSEVTYHYKVKSHIDRHISKFVIGKVEEIGDWDDRSISQLSTDPVDSVLTPDDNNLTPGKNTSPLLWEAFLQLDNTLKYTYSWSTKAGPDGALKKGDILEFSLSLTKADIGAYDGYFTVSYGDGNTPRMYASRLNRLDVTPPIAEISINKNEIWPPNKKMVDIIVDINASDDYDPEPLAILESITANEPLIENDIIGAEYGRNDTQFQLKATRDGKNKDGRIYTITYSVYDGTGNSTQVVSTVTVPHDQR